MSERVWTAVVDRTGWPPGDWAGEPDKVQWTDPDTGLVCLAVRNEWLGTWCGYVGVPPGHPLHGEDEEEAQHLDVHGGLTFSGSCDEELPIERAICHIPEPGQPDDVWWLGFDCAHAWDMSPWKVKNRAEEDGSIFVFRGYETYRTLDYVRGQCASLARQLGALTG